MINVILEADYLARLAANVLKLNFSFSSICFHLSQLIEIIIALL